MRDRFFGFYNLFGFNSVKYSVACKIILSKIVLVFLTILVYSSSATASNSSISSISNNSQCNSNAIQIEQRNAPNQLVDASEFKIKIDKKSNTKPVTQYRYRIINKIHHDTKSFTQGLVLYANSLYESTGLLGESSVRKLSVADGALLEQYKMKNYLFGEGLSVLDNKLVQLTWKSERVITYDPDSLKILGESRISGEGWGVTSVNNKLLFSNGSSVLKKIGHRQGNSENIYVQENGNAVQGLNELEFASGYIYANVWPTDCIAQIDPLSGDVKAWINLSGLYPRAARPHWAAVLNGIAYNKDKNSFYITGKYWPYIYEIELLMEKTVNGSLVVVESGINDF